MEETASSPLALSVVLFGVALCVRGVFSFLETMITSLSLFKLKELSATTKKYAHLFAALEKSPRRILSTILIANSLADVTTAALATSITEQLFAHLNLSGGLGFSLGIIVATIAIIIFGEIIPKNLAKRQGEPLLMSTLWLVNLSYILFYPLVTCLLKFSDMVVYLVGGKRDKKSSDWSTSESEIRFLIRYIRKLGLMDREKSEMLESIFELAQTPVKEIFVPVIDMVCTNESASIQEVLQVFIKENFTRLPIYKDTPENIIGIIHMKDIFALLTSGKKDVPIKELIRPIIFVPESMKINQLLKEFREGHIHMAMVVNEHGSLTGLITLEDILEEIVGDIVDEHEPSDERIIQLGDGTFLADARLTLDELATVLDISFKTEAHTLGGFLAEKLQRVPKKDEELSYKNFTFHVKKSSPKRVLQVLILPKKD